MPRRSVLRLALAAFLVSGVSSCLSPTIPMPPPEINSIQPSEDGFWVVTGSCEPGAFVTVYDDTKSEGVVIQDVSQSGTFLIKIRADRCDLGETWQTLVQETSLSEKFTFKEHLPTDTSLSDTCP